MRVPNGPERSRRLETLHQEVLRGNPIALEELAATIRAELIPRLRRRFSRVPDDCLTDAVHDAILAYAASPRDFDLSRDVPLDIFFYRAACWRAIDSLRAEMSRKRRERLFASARPLSSEGPNFTRDFLTERVARLVERLGFTNTDRKAFRLWMAGAPAVSLVRALGVSLATTEEQRREVKRFKDRIRKRLMLNLDEGKPSGVRARARESSPLERPSWSHSMTPTPYM